MPESQDMPRISMTGFVSKGSKSARQDQTGARFRDIPKAQSAAPGWKSAVAAPVAAQTKRTNKPRTVSRPGGESEEDRRTAGLLIKLGACAAICTLALGLKLINTPETERIAQDVKSVITAEMDVDETIGKLKFVQNDTEMVFGDSLSVTLPVKGSLRQGFGENGSNGVMFGCSKGEKVVACSDGVVEAVGTDQTHGAYVRVRHAAGLETLAFGLDGISVEQGQPLKGGDVIGKCAGDTIYFETHVNGAPQNPMKLYEAMMNG